MDKKGFHSFIMDTSDILYRFAISRLRTRQDAEDAVQETFERMWKMKDKLSKYEKVDLLALKILRNICIDQFRKGQIELQDLSSAEHVHSSYPIQDKLIEVNEKVSEIERAFRSLPEQQKTIFQLRNIEGYEIKTIAEMLGMKINTVEVNLSRARKNLRIKVKSD